MGIFDDITKAVDGAASDIGEAGADLVSGAVDAVEGMVEEVSGNAHDPGPVTIATPRIGEGTFVPVVGSPDILLGDPEYIDTPDTEFDVGDAHVTIDQDLLVPGTPTAHGGFAVAGQDTTVDIDAPGVDVVVEVSDVQTVDPMVLGMIPAIGGHVFAGSVTVDLQPEELDAPTPPDAPDVDVPPPPTDAADAVVSDFSERIEAIEDLGDSLDIFD